MMYPLNIGHMDTRASSGTRMDTSVLARTQTDVGPRPQPSLYDLEGVPDWIALTKMRIPGITAMDSD
jgi:hypothetical protein